MTDRKEAKHDVWIDFGAHVPMRDGVALAADIYRPEKSREGQPFPAILLRTPYNKATEKMIETGKWFAGRGYAVVAMDVRGRGDSDGLFRPYRRDGQDGYDSVEWCAAQPWCDGKVATLGGSYLGHIQWLTALQQPPHLVTMIVLVTPSDPFVEWPTGTGSPMDLCWHHYTSGRMNQVMEAVDWEKVYWHLPLLTMDELAGRMNPIWRERLAHARLDDFWEPLCYQQKFAQIDMPVLHISGWYDDEQIGTPLNFMGMTRGAASAFARQNQRLLIDP
jgi:putative CocE/NonD family hydrolase